MAALVALIWMYVDAEDVVAPTALDTSNDQAPVAWRKVPSQHVAAGTLTPTPPRGGQPSRERQHVLEGRLLLSMGTPVVGAAIQVLAFPPTSVLRADAQTRDDGRFEVSLTVPSVLRTISFLPTDATPCFTDTLELRVDLVGATSRDFLVPEAATLEVRVVDLHGEAVDAVEIALWSATSSSTPDSSTQPLRTLTPVTNGSVELPSPADRCYGLASGPAHVPVMAAEQRDLLRRSRATMQLVVAPVELWSATVVARDGAPVVGARLTIEAAWNFGNRPGASGARPAPATRVLSGAGGIVSARLAAAHDYRVRVEADSFETLFTTVEGGEAPAQLVLHPASFFRGIVTGDGGVPLPGARVEVQARVDRRTTTDTSGCFTLPACALGPAAVVTIRAHGHVTRSYRIAHDPRPNDEIGFTLAAAGSIQGRIVDAGGRGAGKVRFMLLDTQAGLTDDVTTLPLVRSEHTCPDGTFQFADVERGGHVLALRHPEDPNVEIRFDVTTESPAHLVLPSPALVGAEIFGQVRNAQNGQPVELFTIVPLVGAGLDGGAGSGSTHEFASRDGVYHLRGLPDDRIDLIVSAPGYAAKRFQNLAVPQQRRRFDILLATAREATFRLLPGDTAKEGVLLRFRDPEGLPVIVTRQDGSRGQAVALEPDQPLTLSGLPDGALTAIVQRRTDGAACEQQIEVAGPPAKAIEIVAPQ